MEEISKISITRVDQLKASQISRGSGSSRKFTCEIIKENLDIKALTGLQYIQWLRGRYKLRPWQWVKESSKSSKGTTSWQLKQLTTSMESHSSQSFERTRYIQEQWLPIKLLLVGVS
ncbi:hypothetical protein Lal_00025685 [Lupinus albus]|nr:hypothetical protein Lal_00025685 [Lupinus albus]